MIKEWLVAILIAIGFFMSIFALSYAASFVPSDTLAVIFKAFMFIFVVSVIHDVRKYMKVRNK